jgi:hypothetical protein
MDLDFPSKRDAWLVAVLWLGAAMGVAGSVVVLASEGSLAARLALAAAMLASSALGPWVLYSTSYRVLATEIAVRSGPFRWRVPIATIESVAPSNSPLSSPACSLDRLRIDHLDARGRRRAILLSPADKAGFLAALTDRRPDLVSEGDRLRVRVS